jgi:hypothetical protein
MTEGSKYQFFIPPGLAYGAQPRPTIPGNSVLIFEVELLEIDKPEPNEPEPNEPEPNKPEPNEPEPNKSEQ